MADWLHHDITGIDWHRAFVPNGTLLDVVLRGTVVYLVLFGLLRFFRRQSGRIGTPDVLLIVLVADAVQNAMASDYHSITEGLCLVLTIFFWSWLLNLLAFRVPALRPLISPAPQTLIRNGAIDRRALRRALITEDDLRSKLRVQGVYALDDVLQVWLEGDGQFSVQKKPSA